MLSTISSLVAAFIAAMLTFSPPRLSPLQRARAVQWQAWAAARTDRPVTRADAVAATLDRDPITPVGSAPDPEPPLSDHPPITPAIAGQADEVVSFTEAAARLGISPATARRYAAPSSGRLIRLGDGVTLASLEACAATR